MTRPGFHLSIGLSVFRVTTFLENLEEILGNMTAVRECRRIDHISWENFVRENCPLLYSSWDYVGVCWAVLALYCHFKSIFLFSRLFSNIQQ